MTQFKYQKTIHCNLITVILMLTSSAFLGAIFAILLIGNNAQAARTVASEYTDNLAVRTLTIVDQNKKPRGHIFVEDNGLVGMVFTDSNGLKRLSIQAGDNSSSFELFNQDGSNRYFAGIDNLGYGGIHLRADNGSTFSAGTSKDRPMLVALTDENKRVRHAMGFDNRRTSYVMTGPSGDEANLIFMKSDGSRGFSLTRRRSGGPIAVLGMDGDRPSLVLHDDNKSGLAMGYAANGEPGVLINRDGVPIWKAGAGNIRQSAPSVIDLIK